MINPDNYYLKKGFNTSVSILILGENKEVQLTGCASEMSGQFYSIKYYYYLC